MGNSAIGRGTAVEEQKVKASSGDSSPGYLDAKVDGSTIQVIGDQLVGVGGTTSAFHVALASTMNNIAINTTHTIVFSTEHFDIGNDFSGTTFTAPVTGKYQISVMMYMQNVDSAATNYNCRFVSSGNSHYMSFSLEGSNDRTQFAKGISLLVNMAASDTLTFVITQSAGTAQTEILGTNTEMSGFLVL